MAVATGWPGAVCRGPTRCGAQKSPPRSPAIRSQTSGWACQAYGKEASSDQDAQRQEGDGVDDPGQDDAGDENPPQERTVELEVHEEGRDHRELEEGEDQQEADEQRGRHVDVVEAVLE